MKGHLINGEWRESTKTRRNINPSDLSDVEGIYAEGEASDVNDAVVAARGAAQEWSQSTPQQRFDVLDAVGAEILERAAELGELLAREEGKTRPEATGEVKRAGQIFKYYAGEALRGESAFMDSVRPGVEVTLTREPIGVVGMVTPWNFPIAIPAWKIAPALAYGNAAILKPAEHTPGCAWALAEILSRANLPRGTFQMIMGDGSVGAALVANQEVDAISFTGSVNTGSKIAQTCVGRMAKFQLEMGGKNPLVVLDDADLDVAVGVAVNGAFFSTGQRCTASSRLIVTEGIHDRFVNAVTEKLKSLVVGPALNKETHIGPVIDGGQLEKIERYIAIGREEGARLEIGGDRPQLGQEGYYLNPTLFTETNNQMLINRDEIFGPVATVIRVKDYEEALAIANDTDFGLSSGICTTSLKYANDFRRRADAGMVMVNLPTAGVDYHVPFGGRKGSSYGPREQGAYAREFYTTVKTTYSSC